MMVEDQQKTGIYNRSQTFVDCALGGAVGGAFVVLTLIAAHNNQILFWIFLLITAFAFLFGLRALWRLGLQVECDHLGLTQWGWGIRKKHIPWSQLTQLKLRYYATRGQAKRDKPGQTVLTIRAEQGAIRVDNGLTTFDHVAAMAFQVGAYQQHGKNDGNEIFDEVSQQNAVRMGYLQVYGAMDDVAAPSHTENEMNR